MIIIMIIINIIIIIIITTQNDKITKLQYDRLELKQSKLLYLSSETSPEASQ